jgi:hypothetical protein
MFPSKAREKPACDRGNAPLHRCNDPLDQRKVMGKSVLPSRSFETPLSGLAVSGLCGGRCWRRERNWNGSGALRSFDTASARLDTRFAILKSTSKLHGSTFAKLDTASVRLDIDFAVFDGASKLHGQRFKAPRKLLRSSGPLQRGSTATHSYPAIQRKAPLHQCNGPLYRYKAPLHQCARMCRLPARGRDSGRP